jgi:hypothetical protein
MVVEELAAFLVSQGLAVLSTDTWLHVMDEKPDEAMSIIEYAGEEPEYIQDNPKVDLENPRVQIAVRSIRPEVARLRAERVYQSLMAIRNETLNGTRILWCQPIDTPALLGRDESGRFLVTTNFRVLKELTNV